MKILRDKLLEEKKVMKDLATRVSTAEVNVHRLEQAEKAALDLRETYIKITHDNPNDLTRDFLKHLGAVITYCTPEELRDTLEQIFRGHMPAISIAHDVPRFNENALSLNTEFQVQQSL